MNSDISNNYLTNLVPETNEHESKEHGPEINEPLLYDVSENIINILQNPNINRFNFINTDSDQLNNVYGNFLENFIMSNGFNIGSENRINTLLQNTLNQTNNYKNILSKKGKKEIQEELYSIVKYPEQKKCPISQKNFTENDAIIKLPCRHIFSPDLIMIWLENENATCPVCRYKLDSKEQKITLLEETAQSENGEPVPIHRTRRMSQIDARNILRNSINNILIREQEKQEEEDLQAAIMASLCNSNTE